MLPEAVTILYPILHYPPVIGGLEQWAQNIAERQGAGVRILIVTGRVKGQPNFETKNTVSIFRTSLFALNDLSHSSWLYILTTIPFILFRSFVLARRSRVGAFHCHGFISGAMGFILSLATRKPFIGTEQSVGWSREGSRFLRSMVYRRAAACIAASNAVAEEFEKLGVKRIEVIPNGVDVRVFTRRGKVETQKYVILSVGRLEKVKGHRYLIEAFGRIKQEIPGARLILVGDGSERNNLEKQTQELGLEKEVEFVGEVRHEELPRWHWGANVFVMPSLSEGFGITAIEAMAAGVPLIATRVGGLVDIVRDGETGMLVEPRNSQQIQQAVVRVLEDKVYADKLVQNATHKAEEFDWQKSTRKVRSIYRSMI